MKNNEKIVLPKDLVVTDSEEEREMDLQYWKRADDDYEVEEEEDEDKISIPPRRLKVKKHKVIPKVHKTQLKRKIVYEYSSSDDDDEQRLPIKRKKKGFTAPPPTPEKIQREKPKKEKSNFYSLSKKIRDYDKEWFTPKKMDDVKLFQSALVNILSNKTKMNEQQRTLLTMKNKTKLHNILGVKPSRGPNGQKLFVLKTKVPTTKSVVRNIKNLPTPALKEIAKLMKQM